VILVTRLNDTELALNADLIEFVEAIPETIISLTTGKKIMVTESVEEVIARVIAFRKTTGVPAWMPDARAKANGD
jgi:flagellar protein FlbD